MIEYLYLSVLDDGDSFEFVSVDTLVHPLDFLDEVSEVRKDRQQAAQSRALNSTEIYGCFGPSDEVASFEDDVLGEVGGSQAFRSQRVEHEGPEYTAVKAACAKLLHAQAAERPDSRIRICRKRDADASFALLLLMDGGEHPSRMHFSQAYSSRVHCQIAIEELANAWPDQEEPFFIDRP